MSGASEEYEDDCDDDGYWGKYLLVYGRQCIGWVRVALIFFFFCDVQAHHLTRHVLVLC